MTSNLIDEDHAPFFTPKKEQIVFFTRNVQEEKSHMNGISVPIGFLAMHLLILLHLVIHMYTCIVWQLIYCLLALLMQTESTAGSVAHTQHKFMLIQ